MLIRLSDYSQYSFGNFSPGSLIIALVIVGVLNNSHVLLTKSIKEIGTCKEFLERTSRASALRRYFSCRNPLRWPIYIITSVDETKLSLNICIC